MSKAMDALNRIVPYVLENWESRGQPKWAGIGGSAQEDVKILRDYISTTEAKMDGMTI